MTIYYTKAGDTGETGVFGRRLKKTDPRIAAIGDVDELNAALGVALAFTDDGEVRRTIVNAQNLLFTVGAELAGTIKVRVTTDHVDDLRKMIDRFAGLINPQTAVTPPDGTTAASFLHLAHAVCERASRSAVTLNGQSPLNPELLRYLDLLSSLLSILARHGNRKITEQAPTY